MMTTEPDAYFYPFLLTTLVVMRAGAPQVYKRYALENGSVGDVLTHLRSLSYGETMLTEHVGIVLEAHLIAAKSGRRGEKALEYERYVARISDQTIGAEERQRADKMVKILNHMSGSDSSPSLQHVVSKIELATQFKQ